MRWLGAALALWTAAACAGGNPWLRDGRASAERARALAPDGARARNVILFLGDGMDLPTITAARIFDGQRRGEPGEENLLAFERLPYVALSKTYNTNQQGPDSAGTMTALVTGAKTRAGVLSVNASVPRGAWDRVAGNELRTILEQAEERGLSTGVVTTTTVTHATPAACYAHSPERSWENDSRLPPEARAAGFADVARQLVEQRTGDGLEVALGGGRVHFLPQEIADPEVPELRGRRLDGRDLTAEWLESRPDAAYVWSHDQLRAIDPARTGHLLGLFEPSHMHFEVDRPEDPAGEPSLAEMTAAALSILERNPRGYFLMVEGGRIDHAHHLNSAYRALTETIAFADAVQTALDRTDATDTLVVVTADHGHTLSMGGYATRGNPILGLVIENDDRGEPNDEPSRDGLGLPYTTLAYQNGPGYTGGSAVQPEGSKQYPHLEGDFAPASGRPDLSGTDPTSPDYLQETTVPLRSETHSGVDVPIYAGGPGAALFHGVQEQSAVYHFLAEALGW